MQTWMIAGDVECNGNNATIRVNPHGRTHKKKASGNQDVSKRQFLAVCSNFIWAFSWFTNTDTDLHSGARDQSGLRLLKRAISLGSLDQLYDSCRRVQRIEHRLIHGRVRKCDANGEIHRWEWSDKVIPTKASTLLAFVEIETKSLKRRICGFRSLLKIFPWQKEPNNILLLFADKSSYAVVMI